MTNLLVTQADRDAAATAVIQASDRTMDIRLGEVDHLAVVQAAALHRQSHSLPGDVGMRGPYASDDDLIEAAVQAALDAGLAENGVHGVGAARHAARFVVESREYWRNIERANLADEVRQIKEAKQAPAIPADVGMNLAAAFGPILKEAFPDHPAQHRHAACDALANAVIARASWFAALTPSALTDLQRLGQEFDAATIASSVEMPFVEGGPLLDDGMCDDHGAFGCRECLAAFAAKRATPSALSGDAGEGETLREALAKRTSMSTIAGGGKRPHVEIRFANVADAHALTDAILNRSNKEDDHGPPP